MKEALEEFGSSMIVCTIGAIVLIGVGVFLKETGLLAELADAYSNYFYGEAS